MKKMHASLAFNESIASLRHNQRTTLISLVTLVLQGRPSQSGEVTLREEPNEEVEKTNEYIDEDSKS